MSTPQAQMTALRAEMDELQRKADTIRSRVKSRWNDACGREDFYYATRDRQALDRLCQKINANSEAQDCVIRGRD